MANARVGLDLPVRHPETRLTATERQAPRPTLIVVTGSPTAGKSSVARLLSQRLGLPLVSRDEIKAALVRTTAPGAEQLRRGGPVAQQSFTYFAEAIDFHIDRSLSLIAEQAFERGKGELFLRSFLNRCDIVQIVCNISRATAIARFEQRMIESDRSTPTDAEVLEMLREGRLDPQAFNTLDLEVSTPTDLPALPR
ncbi:MAG: AAA family ATPase [Acidimicrobiia bacterium]